MVKEDYAAVSGSDPRRTASREETAMNLTPGEKWLVGVYERLSQRPATKSFSHISAVERRRDQEKEIELDARFIHSGGSRSRLLENLLRIEMERADWFGATVFITTKFDDYINGADAVIEWPAEDGNPACRLVVDITAASDPERLNEKLRRIKNGGRVKYFRTDFEVGENEPEEFVLDNAPLVILGVDSLETKILAEEMRSQSTSREVEVRSKEHIRTEQIKDLKKTAFRDHPLQLLLLDEAVDQLQFQLMESFEVIVEMLARTQKNGRPLSSRLVSVLEKYSKNERGIRSILETVSELPIHEVEEILSRDGKGRPYNRFTQLLNVYCRVAAQRSNTLDRLEKEKPAVVQAANKRAKASSVYSILTSRISV
jgi:hypothetical protein